MIKTKINVDADVACSKLSRLDVLCWRLLIWILGGATPLLAALKPRSFLLVGSVFVEKTGGLSHLISQGLYFFFIVLALIAFMRHLSKREKGGGGARVFWLLTILLVAMPSISSLILGDTLQWSILGIICVYSATYFLPQPPINWWVREVRIMILVVFVYGSFIAALLFPAWAWNKDYVFESSVAIIPVRLFGTANHSNALAPLAVFFWMLRSFPNCRLPLEYIHGVAVLLVLILAQSKAILIIVFLLLCSYFMIKIATLRTFKKYLTYSIIALTFPIWVIYVVKYSSYSSRIEDLLYDPTVFTLTGRLPIWLMSINMWLEHPWIGQGLDAWSSDAMFDFVHLFGWAAPNAHNQVFQILSQAGLLGLVVMMLWFFYCFKIVHRVPIDLRIHLWWLISFFILSGITEVVLQYSIGTGHTILAWIIFALVLFAGKSYPRCVDSIVGATSDERISV